jgi:hypothetical protein
MGGVDVKSLKIKNFEQPGIVAELKSSTGSADAGTDQDRMLQSKQNF